MEKHKEETRDARGISWLETLVADLRYGARALLKHPGYALLAVLTLGLGIGANTAIFSVINGVLLKPLPYEHGDRLVVVQQSAPLSGQPQHRRRDRRVLRLSRARQGRVRRPGRIPPDELRSDQSRRAGSRQHRRGVARTSSICSASSRSSAARSSRRTMCSGAEAVLVLSHTYWQTKFGGDPNIVGQVFEMNDRPHRVIGVLPNVPHYPQENDVYMPVLACPFRAAARSATSRRTAAPSRALNVFGRLKPGVIAEQAASAVGAICHTFTQDKHTRRSTGRRPPASRPPPCEVRDALTSGAREHAADPARHHRHGAADRVRERRQPHAGADARPRSRAGDARGARRRPRPPGAAAADREHAAGGCRRRRSASCFAWVTDRHADEVRRPLHVAHRRDRDRSRSCLLFTLGVSIVTGVLFGTLPALGSRVDLVTALKQGGGQAGDSGGRKRMQGALIVAQVAVSVVLLVGAGLLLASFYRLAAGRDRLSHAGRAVGAGLRQLLEVSRRDRRCARCIVPMIERLQSQPGVSVGGDHQCGAARRRRAGHDAVRHRRPRHRRSGAPADQRTPASRAPKYFETLGIPLVSGRVFNDLDTEESLRVDRHQQVDGEVLGRHRSGRHRASRPIAAQNWFTVVGVVGDVRQFGLAQETVAQLYMPLTQTPQGFAGQVLVRTAGDPLVVRQRAAQHRARRRSEPAGRGRADARRPAIGSAGRAAADRDAARRVRGARAAGHARRHRRRDRDLGHAAHQGVRPAHGARRQPRQRADDGGAAGADAGGDRPGARRRRRARRRPRAERVSLPDGAARSADLRRRRRAVHPVGHHRVPDSGAARDDGRSVDRVARQNNEPDARTETFCSLLSVS